MKHVNRLIVPLEPGLLVAQRTDGKWEVFGGNQEAFSVWPREAPVRWRETPQEAAVREFEEESGVPRKLIVVKRYLGSKDYRSSVPPSDSDFVDGASSNGSSPKVRQRNGKKTEKQKPFAARQTFWEGEIIGGAETVEHHMKLLPEIHIVHGYMPYGMVWTGTMSRSATALRQWNEEFAAALRA